MSTSTMPKAELLAAIECDLLTSPADKAWFRAVFTSGTPRWCSPLRSECTPHRGSPFRCQRADRPRVAARAAHVVEHRGLRVIDARLDGPGVPIHRLVASEGGHPLAAFFAALARRTPAPSFARHSGVPTFGWRRLNFLFSAAHGLAEPPTPRPRSIATASAAGGVRVVRPATVVATARPVDVAGLGAVGMAAAQTSQRQPIWTASVVPWRIRPGNFRALMLASSSRSPAMCRGAFESSFAATVVGGREPPERRHHNPCAGDGRITPSTTCSGWLRRAPQDVVVSAHSRTSVLWPTYTSQMDDRVVQARVRRSRGGSGARGGRGPGGPVRRSGRGDTTGLHGPHAPAVLVAGRARSGPGGQGRRHRLG